MALTAEAALKRKEYMAKYREKHKDEILAKQRAYYHANKEKHQQYMEKYWAKKASEN